MVTRLASGVTTAATSDDHFAVRLQVPVQPPPALNYSVGNAKFFRPTSLPGLFFCGQFVSPAGMLREMGIEARRIATGIASAR